MRRAVPLFVALACAMCACGERHPKPVTNGGGIHPAPPPPPGSIAVVGPMRIEAMDVVRSEIGWDRDLVRASRAVDYDVVLAQERATCPQEAATRMDKDSMGCAGMAEIPASCAKETIRARVEVSLRWTIDVQQRCAGDASTYVVPASGDPKPALQTAGAACFRNKNKFKPESTWTSLYALTELSIDEKVAEARTQTPALLDALTAEAPKPTFCRDDGATLDGTPAALPQNLPTPSAATLVSRMISRAPLAGEQGAVAVTNQDWRPEQALWEQCRAPELKDQIVAQERCQLLRQLDRFLRDVEDVARPETPKGAASGAPSASTSASTKKGVQ